MAKRRKKIEEEEELEFEEPEFNEKEYLIGEIKKGRGIFIVFILAIVMGFVSAYLQVYVNVIAAFLVGIIPLFALNRILQFFKAEFKTRGTWVYAVLAFILIWISIWSVGLNPPFNDLSPPQIKEVDVLYNGTWVSIFTYPDWIHQDNINKIPWDKPVDIRVSVTDNAGISIVQINGHATTLNKGYYEVDGLNVNGEIKITAWDVNDHQATETIPVS